MKRYYVTDRKRGDVVACARRAVADGVDMIQVREKDMEGRELLELVQRVIEIAKGSSTKVLVNDRLDVAIAAGADGVHLPADGLPIEAVRPRVNLLGVSTHTIDELRDAESRGVDFVVFGPVFETPGKRPLGLDQLRAVTRQATIPVYGIGGITPENAADVIAAGATGIAGIRMFQE